nr:isoflavone 3'-hydroxylase-like [Tanacetum cinerariifolium]
MLRLQFGTRPFFLVSSPAAIEECLTTNDINFANRPHFLAGKYLGYNYTSLFWSDYGDHWRGLRRIATVELLSSHRLQTLNSIRAEEVQLLVKRVYQSAMKYGTVEMKSMFFELMLNVLMMMIAGKRYYGDSSADMDEAQSFKKLVKESFLVMESTDVSNYIPWLKWVVGNEMEKKMAALGKRREEFMQSLIDENRRNSIMEKDNKNHNFIEVLLKLQESQPEYYKDEIIKGLMQVLLSGGSDTSSAAMEWTLSLLLNNPEALQKAQDEIDRKGIDHDESEAIVSKVSTSWKDVQFAISVLKEKFKVIYSLFAATSSENLPPMLNKKNYVSWSSRLLRYAKSRQNGKLIHNSIINGQYVRRMISEPGDPNLKVHVNETFHVQTDDELTEKELKQIEADDQTIQTILLGLPEDIYAADDSCETAQEIWFTSTDGESIESYYHRFLKFMNDLKRNKYFPEKIASNLKFLNNLQPEWSRHVIIVHQIKDLHIADYTQLYDFLKYNQKEVDDLKAERLARTQDPLALMATSNNPYTFPVLHQDQPSFNQNYMQQPMPNLKDITDPTTAMNMALALMSKAFKLNYSTPANNNQRISSNLRNRQIAQPGMNMGQDRQMQMVGGNGGNQFRQYVRQNVGNLNGYNDVQNVGNQGIQNVVQSNPNENGNLVATRAEGNATGHNRNQIRCYNCRGVGHFTRNCIVKPRRRDAAYLQTQLLIAQKEEAGIQLQAEEFDLMAAASDLDEIKEVNANCILMANLQQASTSGTQTDEAPVYDSDGSAEVHNYENCYDDEIFNMFTQEEQYTELLEPIPESHQVPQNDNNVIFEVFRVEQSGGTIA